MISVEQAWQFLSQNASKLSQETLTLDQLTGYYLAEDIISKYDHPFFDHSAVDGYAIEIPDVLNQDLRLKVSRQIQPGEMPDSPIQEAEAIRIFTGAATPYNCDLVVMQEKVKRDGDFITIPAAFLIPGANIRRKGEQITKGEVALKGGTLLNPAAIGHLSSLGIKNARVFRKPKVTVIVTGNEFLQEGEEPQNGKIFESNGIMLKALLKAEGIEADLHHCPDDLSRLTLLIKSSEKADLLLVTGGASVGDFDFTRRALEASNHEIIFHQVNQKPGKPLLFSKSAGQSAFGLPGNPRAVLVCFYLYVHAYLRACQGATAPVSTAMQIPIAAPFEKQDHKTHFVTVGIENGKAVVLKGQASHMLQSASGNLCIAKFPAEKNSYHPGDLVDVFLVF